DARASNFFLDADVQEMARQIISSRTPGNGQPAPGDKPFMSTADQNIENTLFRAAAAGGARRLFELDPGNQPQLAASAMKHPYLAFELLKKIYNSVTTRSNVFAVYLTVGFFEVDAAGNPDLTKEVGALQNRQIRHRMFAIVDRSVLTVETDAKGIPQPGKA